jgi:hypothetical protein
LNSYLRFLWAASMPEVGFCFSVELLFVCLLMGSLDGAVLNPTLLNGDQRNKRDDCGAGQN